MKRLGLRLLFLVLLLLAASNAWRLLGPAPPLPADRLQITVSGAETGAQFFAWREKGPTSRLQPPVVLLNGSPPIDRLLEPLARVIGQRGRQVLLPDLPGFGHSTTPSGGYAFGTQAELLGAWMDSLSLPPVHLVAYSQSGGAALHLADARPELLASLTLLSSIGVIEHELLGDYTLNHSLHGLQLIGIRLFGWLLPHFGLLDDFPFNLAYARSFHQGDQRPLRGMLERWDGPALVIHGARDRLVPVSAALEHARLLPQADLVTWSGGHSIAYTLAPEVAETLEGFMEAVDHGQGVTRTSADTERRLRSGEPARPMPRSHGIALWLTLIGIALATLLSEDLSCIAAGLLAARGWIGYPEAVAAAFAGIVIGDLLLFLLGRLMGYRVTQHRLTRRLAPAAALERARRWFDRRGAAAVLVSRFIPGTRLPTYVAAGISGASAPLFLFWFLLAAALWTPLLVGAAMLAGEQLLAAYETWSWAALPSLLLLLALLHLLFRTLPQLVTQKGRRLLAVRLLRLKRWEHWPAWLFYAPVVLHVIGLGLRHRSPTLFCAANPGIPLGGFRGESKAGILQPLLASGDCAPFRVLSHSRREDWQRIARQAVEEFGFPLVLKPDKGERGRGVRICRNEAALREALDQAESSRDWLLQAFAKGEEYGVFYARHPDEKQGRVLSITRKEKTRVRGDGRRTLEELILSDPATRAMADHFLSAHSESLDRVLSLNETFIVAELGTHALGATFRDARTMNTPELEAAIEGISRRLPGFFFGRYDLVVPDTQALQEGRELQVLELNGVTGEMAHIYDPGNSVRQAWKTLRQQWRLAFEIGRANRARGAQVATLGDVLLAVFH